MEELNQYYTEIEQENMELCRNWWFCIKWAFKICVWILAVQKLLGI